jgi:hypothetical protein
VVRRYLGLNKQLIFPNTDEANAVTYGDPPLTSGNRRALNHPPFSLVLSDATPPGLLRAHLVAKALEGLSLVAVQSDKVRLILYKTKLDHVLARTERLRTGWPALEHQRNIPR